MNSTPRVLHLEDDPADVLLVRETLKEVGLDVTITAVASRTEFATALASGAHDLILSDYFLPAFDGVAALEMSRAICPDIPFIFVTGALGDERAVTLLKSGATDYVLKDRLSRLAPAIVRSLAEARERTARTLAEEEIRQLNAMLEARVQERTAELTAVVAALEAEIAARRKLEREVLEISEREQNRLGQDMHDGLGQELAGIAMLGEALGKKLHAESHPAAKDAKEIANYTRRSIQSARRLAKGLYPLELSRHGLFAALAELARQTAKLSGAECTLIQSGELPGRGGFYEIHTYRIVQECISNAIRHGKASRITIEATATGPFLAVTVTDNGIGFELPVGKSGMGLHLMDYRARLIGGGVDVEKPLEGGCRVTCRVMVEEKQPQPTGIDVLASAQDGSGGPNPW